MHKSIGRLKLGNQRTMKKVGRFFMKVKKKKLKLKGGLVLETHLHGSAVTRAYFLNGKQLGKFEQISIVRLAKKLRLPIVQFAAYVGFDVTNPWTRAKLGI